MLALSLLILCMVPMQAFALGTYQATNSERGTLWISITEFTNSFEISGSGLAQFDTSLYARSNINKVVINAGIQQYINGNWQTIKSWTSTSYSNSGYLNQEWYLMSGYPNLTFLEIQETHSRSSRFPLVSEKL